MYQQEQHEGLFVISRQRPEIIFGRVETVMRPRTLTLNDFAPSTNSTRRCDKVGTIRRT
jgi:hypothetical protein